MEFGKCTVNHQRQVVKALIDWGNFEDTSEPKRQLTLLFDIFHEMCWCTANFWYEVARQLTTEECASLVKGLVFAKNRWSIECGSVSPVVWVFKALTRQVDTRDLADWVLARTRNPFEPFGIFNKGAASVTDLQADTTPKKR